MSKDVKLIRGQLRQVVKEILPEMLKEVLGDALFKAHAEDINTKLKKIEENVRETLTLVDKRSKDSLSYLIRQTTENAVQTLPVEETANSE